MSAADVVRRLAAAVLFTVTVWVVAGPWVAVPAALAAAPMVPPGRVRPEVLLRAAVVLMAAAPLAWLWANLALVGTVTPALVTQAPWPGRLVATALAVGTVGLVAQVLGSAGDEHRTHS